MVHPYISIQNDFYTKLVVARMRKSTALRLAITCACAYVHAGCSKDGIVFSSLLPRPFFAGEEKMAWVRGYVFSNPPYTVQCS